MYIAYCQALVPSPVLLDPKPNTNQQDQEQGVVLHDQDEGYQPPKTSRSKSSQVPQAQGLSMTHPGVQVDSEMGTWGSST